MAVVLLSASVCNATLALQVDGGNDRANSAAAAGSQPDVVCRLAQSDRLHVGRNLRGQNWN